VNRAALWPPRHKPSRKARSGKVKAGRPAIPDRHARTRPGVLADGVGAALTSLIERPLGLPVASLRSLLPSAPGTEGRELPGQWPRGKSQEGPTPWSRPRLPVADDGSDCVQPRSPPYGAPHTRTAGSLRPSVPEGTEPSPAPRRPVALSGATRRKRCGHGPVSGRGTRDPCLRTGNSLPIVVGSRDGVAL